MKIQEKKLDNKFSIKSRTRFHQVDDHKEQVCSSLVFSHPDYTVGSGIAPDQLALTDLSLLLI